ncbi:MAG TPA: hypothetical protein VGQ76_06425 [Thermoanaerobaculia bacterium]|jgi:hypothetical protein|nr:hypothetical protein [Thermoanaerobaculia bacterium]
MKRICTLTLVVCLLATAAYAEVEGAWTASIDEKRPDRIYMSMIRGTHNNMGTTMRISDFAALTRTAIDAPTMTPVNFQLRREAGTATFEGTFKKGKGAGQFTFVGNRAYINAVRALGVPFELNKRKNKERTEEEDLFSLALHDVSTAFIKSMQAEGFKESLEKYLTMRIFDITPEYVREMRSLGFKNIDSEELVATKIHRVTPEYVRKMRAAGWDLTLDELQSSRIHGATPEFAGEMHKLGYKLDFDDLVSFRIHRVTAEFINELRTLGYDKVSADDLVSMRIHRVTPEFIRELKAAGYSKVPVDKLVSMRIHKIDAQYLKKMGRNDRPR